MGHSVIPLYLLAVAVGCGGRCIHDQVQGRVSRVSVRYPGGGGSPRATPPSPRPIRIAAFYPSLPLMALRPDQAQRLNASVQAAIVRVSQLLAVVPVVERLLLSRDIESFCKSVWRNQSLPNFNKCGQLNPNYQAETCLDVVIPDDHLSGLSMWPAVGNQPVVVRPDGAGVRGADYLLYIKAADTSKCRREPAVLAYASFCRQDQLGRPVAGSVTFCHQRLRAVSFHPGLTTMTTIHELLHALGFSKDLFNSWMHCSSDPPRDGHCSPRRSVTNTDGGTVRIFTPSVIAQMQLHLDSPSPRLGGPLENAGAWGEASSHWESRVLQGSIMAATLGAPHLTLIDRITAAAMADTGWYWVRLDGSAELEWGRGQGENFGLVTTCHDNSSQYFCSGRGRGCHYLHTDRGICDTDNFLDGCRIYKPLANGSECWRRENGRDGGNLTETGEHYGPGSRCFLANLTLTGGREQPIEGRCYLHRCRPPGRLQVRVQGSAWMPCDPGDRVQVPGYRGHLSCPEVLCRHGDRDPDYVTPDPRLTGVTTPPAVSEPPRPCVGGEGEGRGPLVVQLEVAETPPCEEEGALEKLAERSGIPRQQLLLPRLCGPHLLCVELWGGECGGASAHSLLRGLQQQLRAGPLTLGWADGRSCTLLAARSVWGGL